MPLLERVNDARRVGATILALDAGDRELDALAHESLAAPSAVSFDAAQHLVSAAAGDRAERVTPLTRAAAARRHGACGTALRACSTS